MCEMCVWYVCLLFRFCDLLSSTAWGVYAVLYNGKDSEFAIPNFTISTSAQVSLKDKVPKEQEETLLTLVTETLTWLDAQQSTETTKDTYDEKRKEVEAVASPIITAAYNAAAGTSDASGAAENADTEGAADEGPTVEEVPEDSENVPEPDY